MPTPFGHNRDPQDCFSDAVSHHHDINKNKLPDYHFIGRLLNAAKRNLAITQKHLPKSQRKGWIEFRDEQLADANIKMSASDAQASMLIADAHEGDGKRKGKYRQPWFDAALTWWSDQGNSEPSGQRAFYDMLRAYKNKDKVPTETDKDEEDAGPIDLMVAGESVDDLKGRIKILMTENLHLHKRLEALGHPEPSAVGQIMQTAYSATEMPFDQDDQNEIEAEGYVQEHQPETSGKFSNADEDRVLDILHDIQFGATLDQRVAAYDQLGKLASLFGLTMAEICDKIGEEVPRNPIARELFSSYCAMHPNDPKSWIEQVNKLQKQAHEPDVEPFLVAYGAEDADEMLSAYAAATATPADDTPPAPRGRNRRQPPTKAADIVPP